MVIVCGFAETLWQLSQSYCRIRRRSWWYHSNPSLSIRSFWNAGTTPWVEGRRRGSQARLGQVLYWQYSDTCTYEKENFKLAPGELMDTFVFKCSPSVFYVGELMLLSAGPGRPKLWNARGDHELQCEALEVCLKFWGLPIFRANFHPLQIVCVEINNLKMWEKGSCLNPPQQVSPIGWPIRSLSSRLVLCFLPSAGIAWWYGEIWSELEGWMIFLGDNIWWMTMSPMKSPSTRGERS